MSTLNFAVMATISPSPKFELTNEDYESIKELELQFGPFIAEDRTEAFKGKTITFPLPR
ncbi:hypothetical protein [Jeotgalibacillus sp. S-D1]|uniref:hypothetical protein n=1 Tax=Jeotgalibacillus sp. S-D1 TaxID=2552189 RepID=UPI00140471EA|nr:hypothetical protein [Jeotgalibacillus sp. S-D1]